MDPALVVRLILVSETHGIIIVNSPGLAPELEARACPGVHIS